jgi:NmrA-like family
VLCSGLFALYEEKRLLPSNVIRLQGGSVVATYLKRPERRIRAITRDPSKPAAKKLEAQGMEVVDADLNDVDSLVAAFKASKLPVFFFLFSF